MPSPTPVALTIAGSDPGGGAGIQADLKTFAALGTYGTSVVTALTAQNTKGVQAVAPVADEFVGQQIDSILDDFTVAAVKTGMLAQARIVSVVAAKLRAAGLRPVLDPVMVATSGDRLIDDTAVAVLRHELIPLALLLTPNLAEAAALLGEAIAASEDEVADQARRLLDLGPDAVLLKGGHAAGANSVDIFVDHHGVRRFSASRIATRHTHGTGCTLSAAIVAGLARGLALEEAVACAKTYVTGAIEGGTRLGVGQGAGPLDHFWERSTR